MKHNDSHEMHEGNCVTCYIFSTNPDGIKTMNTYKSIDEMIWKLAGWKFRINWFWNKFLDKFRGE